MKKMILKTGFIALCAGVLFSGCGAPASIPTITKIGNSDKSSYRIYADSDSVSNPLSTYTLKTTNYKYAFAMAAKLAKDNNFAYFSISSPSGIVDQYKNRQVKNVNDAYNACLSGDGDFAWEYSVNFLRNKSNCDSIASSFSTYGMLLTNHRLPVTLFVKLHNEDKKDNITFNADEVLNSPLIKELDMSKIANIPVREY